MALCPLIIYGVWRPLLLRPPGTRRSLFCVAQFRSRSGKRNNDINNLEKKISKQVQIHRIAITYFIIFIGDLYEKKFLKDYISVMFPLFFSKKQILFFFFKIVVYYK